MMRNSDSRWLTKTIIPELLRIVEILEETDMDNTAVLVLAVVDEITDRAENG